jgi:DNA polymerase-1
MGLKDYSARYLTHTAKDHEKILSTERSAIAKEINMKLRMRLKGIMTLAQLEDFFSDPIHDYTDLPEELRHIYLDWLAQDVPLPIQKYVHGILSSDNIPYNMLNRQNLIKYAHYDVIYTLEIWLQMDPIVKARKNTRGIEIENSLIMPLYEMERVGFKADKGYIKTCRINLKEYIKERRERLYVLMGQQLTIGQHALIKSVLNNDYGLNLNTTNGEELELLLSDLKHTQPDNPAIEVIELIEELRTLEKWYSTYIVRFLNDLKDGDRLYTTINQVGTVSGRVTSDFQQFPKEPIIKKDGTELFYPRKMINVTGGDYDSIVYLD